MSEPTTQYWHLYVSVDVVADVCCHMVLGPTSLAPDDETGTGVRVYDAKIPAPLMSSSLDSDAVSAVWTTSWEHEPSAEEIDHYLPQGHRSTDDPDVWS